jgi:hypothetical protein
MDILDGSTTQPASSREISSPTVPPQKFQEEAFQYVSQWCKASRDYVSRKVERWKLLQDLYHNRRELNSWSTRAGFGGFRNRSGITDNTDGRDRWQADIVLSPSYIVDNWADRAYQAIFNGPEWLTVISDGPGTPTDATPPYPTAFKLQELLLSRLAEGQIHVRLYEILQHLVLYGSVYAKIFWYSKPLPGIVGTTKRLK